MIKPWSLHYSVVPMKFLLILIGFAALAGDWPQFRQALAHWGAAAMNFVYADTNGNIGWQAAGFLPRRPNWDGLTPVPGDGRYEWDGFLRQDELPSRYNPDRG